MALLIHTDEHTSDMIDSNGGLGMFSDGAFKSAGLSGSGVFVPSKNIYLAHGRSPSLDPVYCSALSAELWGIYECMRLAVELKEKGDGGGELDDVFVYTDSYCSLVLLEIYMHHPECLSEHCDVETLSLIVEAAKLIINGYRCKVRFCKVKSKDVLGNQVADKLAKVGSRLNEGQTRRCVIVGDFWVPLIEPEIQIF